MDGHDGEDAEEEDQPHTSRIKADLQEPPAGGEQDDGADEQLGRIADEEVRQEGAEAPGVAHRSAGRRDDPPPMPEGEPSTRRPDRQPAEQRIPDEDDDDRRVAGRPYDADALAGPERAEGDEHDAHGVLEAVLRDSAEGLVDHEADRGDEEAGHDGPDGRGSQVPRGGAEGDDDEGH